MNTNQDNKEYETSMAFSRDVIIALLWGTPEWLDTFHVDFLQCRDAVDADAETLSSCSSGRLAVSYENLGMRLFNRIEDHQGKEDSLIAHAAMVDNSEKALAIKKSQLMSELEAIKRLQVELSLHRKALLASGQENDA